MNFNCCFSRGLPLQLLESYLNNRLQFTVVNNTKSKFNHVTCCVPQGSTLGPLLFLISINDLPLVSNFNTKLFADNTVLTLTNSCQRPEMFNRRPNAYFKFSWSKEVYENEFRESAKTYFGEKLTNQSQILSENLCF